MIIDTKKNSVIQSRYDMPESDFKLEKSELPMFMEIFRNQIYTNKVAAVVREYTTNALDEHIKHNVAHKPVLLTCPNLHNPIFSVRDYGVGISDDDIRDVYASYGKSTKRETNDLTGCMGIGCKSGFAYADSFTIISIVSDPDSNLNIKSTYSAILDESNIGKIKRVIDPHATDEPTGIEIKIGVASNDISSFQEEVRRITWSSQQPITVTGYETRNRAVPEIDNRDEGYRIYRSDKLADYSACAHMGNIIYPIDTAIIKKHTNDTGVHAAVSMPGLEIDFDLGDLGIAASREALSYTEKTVNKIVKELKRVADAMTKEFVSLMKAEDCLLLRIQHAWSAKQAMGTQLFNHAIHMYGNQDFSWGDTRFWFQTLDNSWVDQVYIRDLNVRKYHKESTAYLPNAHKDNHTFILCDTSSVSAASIPRRVKTILAKESGTGDYIDSEHTVYLFTYDSKDYSEEHIKKHYKLDQVYSKDILVIAEVEPLPSKVADRKNKATTHVTLFEHNTRYSWGPQSAWQETKVSIGGSTSLYLHMSGYYGIKADGLDDVNANQVPQTEVNNMLIWLADEKHRKYIDNKDVTDLLDSLIDKEHGQQLPKVYGARKKNWKLLDNAENTYNLYTLYKDAVQKCINKHRKNLSLHIEIHNQLKDKRYKLSEYGNQSSLTDTSNYWSSGAANWFTTIADQISRYIHEDLINKRLRTRIGDYIIYEAHKRQDIDQYLLENFTSFIAICEYWNGTSYNHDLYTELEERAKFINIEIKCEDKRIHTNYAEDVIKFIYLLMPWLDTMLKAKVFDHAWRTDNQSFGGGIAQIAWNYKQCKSEKLTWDKYGKPALTHQISQLVKTITNSLCK